MIVADGKLRSASQTRCILCEQDSWRPYVFGVVDYLTEETFGIVRCGSCGLMMTRPFPGDAEIEKYYPPRYRGNRHSFTERMRTTLRRRALESCFPKNFRGRLLDVGCGDGSFVLEMRRRGWEVGATEIDAATVRKLQANGIEAKTPEEAERQGFDRPFDAVTCWHVMEHVERPMQTAQWVKLQLKPEGIFQVTVPNAECQQARLFGRRWFHLDVPRHRYHFTPYTLQTLLARAAFRPIGSTCFALEYDWFGAIQSSLNCVCSKSNGLFERLTSAAGEDIAPNRAHSPDMAVSYALAAPLAAISLLPLLIAWAAKDGATLTLTCKSQ